MKYDNDYLKNLYNNNSLEDFLKLVNEKDVADPRTRAIIAALKRSIHVLHLEFNPIILDNPTERNKQSSNQPH